MMAMFVREHLMKPGDEAGVSIQDIARAICVWRSMRGGPCSVAVVAETFNTTPDIVVDAVNEDYWMFLNGPDDARPEHLLVEIDGA